MISGWTFQTSFLYKYWHKQSCVIENRDFSCINVRSALLPVQYIVCEFQIREREFQISFKASRRVQLSNKQHTCVRHTLLLLLLHTIGLYFTKYKRENHLKPKLYMYFKLLSNLILVIDMFNEC